MGCLGTRPNSEDKEPAKLRNISLFLDCLAQGQFVETIVINSSIYNYCYLKQRKTWLLRKLAITNSIDQLITSKNELESRNYFHSFIDSQIDSHILLRPVRNLKPSLPQLSQQFKLVTALQKNDTLPQQLLIKFVDTKTSQLLNFSNNGKYTFFLQMKLYKLSSLKQFYRFQQILSIKISQIFKFASFEFYGLINLKPNDKIADLNKFTNKYGWSFKFIDLNENQLQNSLNFNGNQIFHCIDDDGKICIDQDTFYIVDPLGKLIRAEIPEFYVSKKPDQLVQCDDFDDASSQKSKSLNYEKKLLKELHLHYANYISKKIGTQTQPLLKQVSIRQQLTKYQIMQQQFFNSLESISQTQYKDFKQLFKSQRLQQILSKYHPGEPFQFELIKQEYYNYDFEEGIFKLVNKLHILPAIYPTASILKQKILSETCRELKESIGLRWKDPDMNIYSIPHQYTFNKIDLMEFLDDFTKKFHFRLKLFLLKNRLIKWQEKQLVDQLILKLKISSDLATSQGPQPKSEWLKELSNSFIFEDVYELQNQAIVVHDLDELKLIKQQNEQQQQLFKQMKFLNLSSNSLSLIKQYIIKGINYEIQFGQKLMQFHDSLSITSNTILFVLNNNQQSSVLNIVNKLAILQNKNMETIQVIILLQQQSQGEIMRSMIDEKISKDKIQICCCSINESWDKANGLSFSQDISTKYFVVKDDFKAFYFDSSSYLVKVYSSKEFFDSQSLSQFSCENNLIQVDWFISQFGMKQKNQDEQWKDLKNECLQFNSQFDETMGQHQKEFPPPCTDLMSIKSLKCLVWDEHNYNFIEYSNNATVLHTLNSDQIAILKNYMPHVIKLIN